MRLFAPKVPTKFIGTFKAQEKYGAVLIATHRKGLKRNIRFDACKVSLRMNNKLPMDTVWKAVLPAVALEENWTGEKSGAAGQRLSSVKSSGKDRLAPASGDQPMELPMLPRFHQHVKEMQFNWGKRNS